MRTTGIGRSGSGRSVEECAQEQAGGAGEKDSGGIAVRRRPLFVQKKHFRECATQLRKGGLYLDIRIGEVDRQICAIDVSERRLLSFGNRTAMRAVLNPERPGPVGVLRSLRRAKRHEKPKERINVGHGELSNCCANGEYDRVWTSRDEEGEGEHVEGQGLVMTGFDGRSIVGYMGGHISLHVYRDKTAWLHVEPSLVYVIPSRRGQGYGMDLSIAWGYVCGDVFQAVYRALPEGYTLQSQVYADYESFGGEKIGRYIHGCLECARDMAHECGERKSITLEPVGLDAGF